MHACVVHVQVGKAEGNPAIREEKCVFCPLLQLWRRGWASLSRCHQLMVGMRGRDRVGGSEKPPSCSTCSSLSLSADIYEPLVGAQREESEDMEETAWDTI